MVTFIKIDLALQKCTVEFQIKVVCAMCINNQLEAIYFAEIVILPAILFSPKIKVATRKTDIFNCQGIFQEI